MKDLVVWFEIPVSDFQRALKFYNDVLQTKIITEKRRDELMGFLQIEGSSNSGAIVQGPGYVSGKQGTLIYLNGGGDLQIILNRVVNAGGKVLQQKLLVSEAIGNIAIFEDSEGNRIGLHSLQ